MKDLISELIEESDIDPKVWNAIKWTFTSILLAVLVGVLIHEPDCVKYLSN